MDRLHFCYSHFSMRHREAGSGPTSHTVWPNHRIGSTEGADANRRVTRGFYCFSFVPRALGNRSGFLKCFTSAVFLLKTQRLFPSGGPQTSCLHAAWKAWVGPTCSCYPGAYLLPPLRPLQATQRPCRERCDKKSGDHSQPTNLPLLIGLKTECFGGQ